MQDNLAAVIQLGFILVSCIIAVLVQGTQTYSYSTAQLYCICKRFFSAVMKEQKNY